MTEPNPYKTPESTRERPETLDNDGRDRLPVGLGGWLTLVAIGMVLAPLRLSVMILVTFVPLFQNGTWATLTTPGSEQYHPLWAPLLVFEIVGNLGFVAVYAVMIFLFFRKSRRFPQVYIAAALINLCFLAFDAWLCSFVLPDEPILDPDTTKEIVRSLASTAIWVPYMLVSKRVKNTFVE